MHICRHYNRYLCISFANQNDIFADQNGYFCTSNQIPLQIKTDIFAGQIRYIFRAKQIPLQIKKERFADQNRYLCRSINTFAEQNKYLWRSNQIALQIKTNTVAEQIRCFWRSKLIQFCRWSQIPVQVKTEPLYSKTDTFTAQNNAFA